MRMPEPNRGAVPPVRDLGVFGALSIGIGGIVGGGIFATIGLAGAEAKGAAWLSFLLGGGLALLTAYAYVRLTLAFPGPGGTVTFITRAFGDGFLAASLNTLLVFGYVMIMALYAMAFANYAQHFFPETTRAAWQPVLASGVIIVLALMNLVGSALVERSEGVLNVGKLAILALFVVGGLASNSLTLDRLAPAEWVSTQQIVATGMLVFLSYEGFELIANASDRIRNPERTLPWAYYGSVAAAIALYMLLVVVTIGHLSFEAIARTQSFALAAAAETFLGGWGFNLLAFGAVLAAASAINADLFGASKLPVILAQGGEAPRRFAREVWHRHPAALALVAIWAVVITQMAELRAISAASSAAFLLVFAMVNLANVRLAVQTDSRRWVGLLGAGACIAALAAMLVQLAVQSSGGNELRLVALVAALPFAFQLLFRRLARTRPTDRPEAVDPHRRRPWAAHGVRVVGAAAGIYLLVAYVVLPWSW